MTSGATDKGDLSVTALYTSAVWWWAELPHAELLITPQARAVFRVTNAVLTVAGCLVGQRLSLRHGLRGRHRTLDALAAASGVECFLELASGLSRRGVSQVLVAQSQGRGVEYTEVDLPHVVRHKRELLERTSEGRAALRQLKLVAADVSDVDLTTLVPADPDPVCVIAEGLLMYLTPDQQQGLWRRVAALLADRPGSTLLFDLTPEAERPQVGWVGRALGRAMQWFTRGRGFEPDQRSRTSLIQELRDCGFTEVQVHDAHSESGASQAIGVRPVPMVVFACGGAVVPYPGTIGS
ncbi:MAG: class I SAM-dependent methyltransferase [Myxococcales bacterium]|nr:class I SAM-dependent methyltransferase [Myxococcales bacterium]